MKKTIVFAAAILVSATAFAQEKQVPADTVQIKNALLSDQTITALHSVIETAKKGLPGSATISAAEATSSAQMLAAFQQQLVALYNERHKLQIKQPADKKQ